jgi:hypothetical protein
LAALATALIFAGWSAAKRISKDQSSQLTPPSLYRARRFDYFEAVRKTSRATFDATFEETEASCRTRKAASSTTLIAT